MRIWFAFVGMLLWAGIYLTGFATASWLLFVPASGFLFGALTGICPSLAGMSKLLYAKSPENPDQNSL